VSIEVQGNGCVVADEERTSMETLHSEHAAKTAQHVNTRGASSERRYTPGELVWWYDQPRGASMSNSCLFCKHAPISEKLFTLVYTYEHKKWPPLSVYTESTGGFPLCLHCYQKTGKCAIRPKYRKHASRHGGLRTLTPDQWVKAVLDTRGDCQYCFQHVGYRTLTIDHKQPLGRGGDHCAANVIPVCRDCNRRKSNMPYAQWIEQEEMRRLAAISVLMLRHAHLTQGVEAKVAA